MILSEGSNYSIFLECSLSRIPQRFRDLPIDKMVRKILGPRKFVSIAFIRESKMKKLNKDYRKISSSTDVLSFEREEGGEILFSINDVRRKAREFGQDRGEYLSYLLIHALLHLKGLSHSSRMDRQEKMFSNFFGIEFPNLSNEPENNSRNRHRHLSSKGSRSRRDSK